MKLPICTIVFLFSIAHVGCHEVLVENADSLKAVIENITEKTAHIIEGIHSSLEYEIARNIENLNGGIKDITSIAMEQLREVLSVSSEKLSSCSQTWSLQNLIQRMHEDLMNCTGNLHDLRTIFSNGNAGILQSIQTYIAELSNIRAYCEALGSGVNDASSSSFGNPAACFIQKWTELNRNVGQLFNQANTSLMHRRTIGKNSFSQCTAQIVQQYKQFLSEAIENC